MLRHPLCEYAERQIQGWEAFYLEEKQPILSLKDIKKVYPGVIALNQVSIDF